MSAKNHKPSTPPNHTGDSLLWQRALENKHNKRLIERLAKVKNSQPKERQAVVRTALRLWEKYARVSPKLSDAELFTAQAVYALDAHTRNLGQRYELPAVVAHAARRGTVETIATILKGKPTKGAKLIAPRIITDAINWGNYRADVPIEQRRNTPIEDYLAGRTGARDGGQAGRAMWNMHRPWGSLPSDKFEGVLIANDESLSGIGVKSKDRAVVFITTDIQSGDLIEVETPDGLFIRRYNFTPGLEIRLEPLCDEYEPLIYRIEDVKIIGRVIHFERDGKIIIPMSPFLRPIRTCAPLPMDDDGILDADWIGEGGA